MDTSEMFEMAKKYIYKIDNIYDYHNISHIEIGKKQKEELTLVMLLRTPPVFVDENFEPLTLCGFNLKYLNDKEDCFNIVMKNGERK